MNPIVSGDGVEVSEEMRQHAESKLQRVASRFDEVLSVHVVCIVERRHSAKEERQTAQIKMQLPGRKLHAEHTGGCIYEALIAACNKLDRQAINFKQRSQVLRKVGRGPRHEHPTA